MDDNKVVDGKTTEVVLSKTQATLAQAKKIAKIQQEGGAAELVKCLRCGKILVRDTSVEREEGDLCSHLYDELGHTVESLRAVRAAATVAAVPEKMIKIAALHRICVSKGIPVSRMVTAIGGDRGLNAPADKRLKPIYVGNARYVSDWAATPEGLALISSIGGRTGTKPTSTKAVAAAAKKPASKKPATKAATKEASAIADQIEQLFNQPAVIPASE